MKVVADTNMARVAEVIGSSPKPLMAREIGHLDMTELHVVASMHERKAMMAEASDGFVGGTPRRFRHDRRDRRDGDVGATRLCTRNPSGC